MKPHLSTFRGELLRMYFAVFVFVKPHLTVFVKKGEVVEDVGAEHDVLPGVHSQHHRHLIGGRIQNSREVECLGS